MFFIGIDIGKRHHEVALIDEKGNVIGEIGNIDRFSRLNQLLAFAGLDASVHQSEDFTDTKNKLLKTWFPLSPTYHLASFAYYRF